MKIVTDAAANISAEKAAELGIEVVPFQVTFMGQTYRDGVDIEPADLYQLYSEHPHEFSSTSQPSVGDFVSSYEKYRDEEILSVQLSSGLSGAYSSAEHAAQMMPEQNVTVFDSKMVGPALGWMVEIAAYGARMGWTKERIIEAMKKVKENTITIVSFSDIRHLIHSGRVNHLQGIVASILKIKPIIGMNPEDGRYSNVGQELTMSRVVRKMSEVVHQKFGDQKIRLQLMHGNNLPGVELLKSAIDGVMNTVEEKLVPVTLVLGAHAGPTVIGLAAMPQAIFDSLMQN
jgi:DegV family protein with EDD domain